MPLSPVTSTVLSVSATFSTVSSTERSAALYFLLTGRPPFDTDNPVRLVAAVLQEQPRFPDDVDAKLPRGLKRAVLRCLEKNREKRYADYAALRSALLGYGSTRARPAEPGMR